MLDLLVLQLITLAIAVVWTLLLRIRPLSLVPMTVALLHVIVLQAWVLVTGLTIGLSITAWRVTEFAAAFLLTLLVLVRLPLIAREWTTWRRRLRRTARLLGRGRTWLLISVPAIMMVYMAGVGVLIGPQPIDIAAYHLVPPAYWVTEGRVVTADWPDARSWWPQGHGLLASAWGNTTRSLHIMLLAGLHWTLLAFAVAWALARQMGGGIRTACLASLLVAAVPIVWAQGPSGLNDVGMSVLALTGVAAFAGRRVGWRHAALGAVAILVGLGVKPTLFLIGPPVVAVGALRLWSNSAVGRNVGKGGAWLALLAVALVLGGFWYGRNAVLRPDHNPLYPSSLNLLGTSIWPGHPRLASMHGHFNLKQLDQNLFQLFYYTGWDYVGLKSAQTESATGWGPLAMGLGWAALLGLALGAPRSRPAIIMIVLMLLLMALGTEANVWAGRLYGYIPIFLVTCIALATPRLRGRAARAIWTGLLILAGATGLMIGIDRTAPAPVTRYWRQGGPLFSTPRILPPDGVFSPRIQAVDRHVPAGATLLVVVGDNSFEHYALLHGRDLSRRLVYENAVVDDAAIDRWRRQGIRHLTIISSTGESLWKQTPESLGLRTLAEDLYEIP